MVGVGPRLGEGEIERPSRWANQAGRQGRAAITRDRVRRVGGVGPLDPGPLRDGERGGCEPVFVDSFRKSSPAPRSNWMTSYRRARRWLWAPPCSSLRRRSCSCRSPRGADAASRIPDHHGMPRAFVGIRLFIDLLLPFNESFNCSHSWAEFCQYASCHSSAEWLSATECCGVVRHAVTSDSYSVCGAKGV